MSEVSDSPMKKCAFWSQLFINFGIVYFGSFYVSVRNSIEKRWRLLFGCLTSSALNFEMVTSVDESLVFFTFQYAWHDSVKQWQQHFGSEKNYVKTRKSNWPDSCKSEPAHKGIN